MQRREFVTLLGGVAASAFLLPLAARAQAPMPVIGFLHSASLEPNAKRLAGFKRGLQSAVCRARASSKARTSRSNIAGPAGRMQSCPNSPMSW